MHVVDNSVNAQLLRTTPILPVFATAPQYPIIATYKNVLMFTSLQFFKIIVIKN